MAAMDTNEEKLDYQRDAVSQHKLLSDKDTTVTRRRMGDESKYVKLDNSLNSNPCKINGDVSSTAEGCLQKSSSVTGLKAGDNIPEREYQVNQSQMVSKSNSDMKANECMTETLKDLEPALLSELIQFNEKVNSCLKLQEVCAESRNSGGDILPQEETENTSNDNEDLQYTDMYLSRTNESDGNVSLVLYDDCVPCITEDESHYITTHEIQLSELSDDEVDCDIGVGSCWDIEDDNQVFSFVDYASFGSDETMKEIGEKVKYNQGHINCGAAVCRVLDCDLCAKAKCSTSECLGKCNRNSEGQIQLSIKTTAQTINEPSNIQEKENILYRARHPEDMSQYVFRGADAKAEKFRDGAKCFIAAPGRLHFGRNLKGKDVNEYSSGASSAVSELDDADKEVRNLTARAFKSLAYPYFDAINFNTSSESSASEHGLGINRWSTFVDLKYGNMNMSQGGHNMMSQKRSTSSFTMAKNKDNKGHKGRTSANIKLPPNNLFNLKRNSHNASASTKKIAVLGKLGQGQSGVITLTETLNFHCNVKSGVSGGERRSKFAQTAAGSRSADEVTNTLPGGQSSEARKPPCNDGETMEDTHKKAIFASRLLKNVISKKMQFEQERKMERGEICEPNQEPSPCFLYQDPDNNKEYGTLRESTELHRQSSKYSEASSDYTIVCVQELGEIVDSSSCDAKSESRNQDPSSQALDTNLESTNELGFDTKKGAFEAAKSTLLRSQNSAFRSWRDGGLEFQREHKNDKTLELKLPSTTDNLDETDLYANSGNSKLTTMSHFFGPSIQLLPNGREVEKQLQTINYSTRALSDKREGGDTRLRSDNTLYVADSTRTITARSPDIKINLKNVKENKSDPFNISKLPISNIVCNDANLIKTADELRCHALTAVLKGESSDKVPHFMVRDVRDHRGKLQTPIHQVRDVRKLVKSSYHFVSLDKKDKSSPVGVNLHSEQRIQKQGSHWNRASVSPIMITCQSVNTNSNVRHSENLIDFSKCRLNEDTFEIDRSSPEGTKTGMSLMHQPTGRVPPVNGARRDSSEVPIGLRIETPTASVEKTPDLIEKKTECPTANIAALEKLQAAVKTMEQLYVFDRNEWKRKSKTHPTLPDSQVLSLITNKGHGEPEEEGGNAVLTSTMDKLDRRDSLPSTDKTPLVMTASHSREITSNKEEKELPKTFYIPHSHEERMGPKLLSQQGGGKGNMYNLSSSQNISVNTSASINMNAAQVHVISQAPYSPAGFCKKSPKAPVSLNISQSRRLVEDMKRPNKSEAGRSATHDQSSISAVPENYLTIPFKTYTTSTKQSTGSSHHKASVYTFNPTGANTQTGVSPPDYMSQQERQQDENRQSPKHPTIVMGTQSQDTPTATIYHHALPITMSTAQPQVLCFSPTMGPLPTIEHFQATQRKMLLDPTTGNYYLVDTPVQAATKRLFDPETGQYIDVPLPQPPMTPLSMPISPLALSPGAYGHPYMMYPSFMSTPTVIPARTMHSQMSMNSEADDVNKGSHSQQNEGVYMESPYYMATGKSPKTHCLNQVRTPQGFINGKQPVNNMASQLGPRIIAPPSFDGTTMSFVVEHG